jgi:hypothetical protein
MQEIQAWTDKFESAIKAGRLAREEYHEAVGKKLKERMDEQIDQRLDDDHGTVKRWQVTSVGSGGGYVAVRAIKSATGANSPGAITNYLENGHKARAKRSQKWERNKSAKLPRFFVDGRGFYLGTRVYAQNIALTEAQHIVQEIEGALK